MTSRLRREAHTRPRRGLTHLASRVSGARLFFVVLALFVLAPAAVAQQTVIYTIRGNTGGNNRIWAINPTTGAETLVYNGYPGGNAATIAVRPSDGMIFYSINATNGEVYRYNPATPAIAPVAIGDLGPTGGTGVSGGFRMAFGGNTLYYMIGNGVTGTDDNFVYTVNQNTGLATRIATVTNTNNGGDMAFNGNTLYVVDQDRRLCTYAGLPANGAAGSCATITMSGSPNTIGIAFDGTGRLLMQTVHATNGGQLWSVSGSSGTLIGPLGGGGSATGDMGSASITAPDISVTKTDGVTNTFQGATATYTVVVRNNGTYAVAANLVDNVPASLTGVTWTCAASAGSTCDAASGSGSAISTGAMLAASGTATYTISGTVNVASGTISNTATVSLDATWLTESNTSNNTATDTTTVVTAADMQITKAAATGFAVGNNANYTLTARNNGPQSAAGTITVTDTLPAGLTYVSAAGTGWSCSHSSGTVTCTRAGPVTSGTTLPAITLTVSVAASAAPSVANTASVASSTTFDPSTSNNSSTVTTNVLYLGLVKSYTLGGPAPTPGTEINYTVAFTNLGGASIQNLVLVDPNTSTTLRINDNADFKVGSVTNALGSLTSATVAYSNNNGATWTYTPSSGAGGAPAGYDRNVTHIRWTFTGSLSPTSPNNTGNVNFSVRIR